MRNSINHLRRPPRHLIPAIFVREFRTVAFQFAAGSLHALQRKAPHTKSKVHPKSFVDLSSDSQSQTLNLLSKQRCTSCGIKLQSEDPNALGYYRNSTVKKENAPTREIDSRYVSMLGRLSPEERALLVNDTDFSEPKAFVPYSRQTGKEAKSKVFKSTIESVDNINKRVNCYRCHQALNFNVYQEAEHESLAAEHLLKDIPANANIVYVLTARDFPLGLNREIINKFKASKIHYVVNKVDHFFDDIKQPFKTGTPYFRDSLKKLVGADPKKVFLASAKLFWGTERLLKDLPKGNVYFLGEVNSGKSTLIKSLLYNDNLSLSKRGNYGPGISSFPSFTRERVAFPLSKGTTIIDVPGFTETGTGNGASKYLDVNYVKQVNEKPVYLSPDKATRGKLYRSRINKIGSYNGKRVLSVNGLFFLMPPPETVVKFRMGIPGKAHVFSNYSKALECFLGTRKKALGDIYCMKEEAYSDMVHYVVPPFFGSVELVVGGIGYITITPTSSKYDVPVNELFEIWVPRSLKVCIREPISHYIYKTRSKFDAKGNLLNKEESKERGVFELIRVPEKKAIVSKLFEVSDDVEKPAEIFADEFYQRKDALSYENIELIDPVVDSHDKYPNFYWDESI